MSKIICIMGESGAGKTTSCRNLDPTTTYYIDCDKKGLSWKGWKQQYNAENKNYFKTDNQNTVLSLLHGINDKATHIKTVIVDTINGIMVADEMRRSREKGYDHSPQFFIYKFCVFIFGVSFCHYVSPKQYSFLSITYTA